MIRQLVTSLAATVVVFSSAGSLAGQTPPVPQSRLDLKRAQATRAELEASLIQIDSILKSPGYSSRIREAKRKESTLIRERLVEGDLQVGDQMAITVLNETAFTGTFTIQAGRQLVLPGIEPIPVRGVLRSEAEGYVSEKLAQYVRNPSVRVVTSIRLAVLGAVEKQGFYQVPADVLISDAIMLAGGPIGIADPNQSRVVRASSEILTRTEVEQAIVQGATLDQLNLRAGDQIYVDEKAARAGRTVTFLAIAGLITSVVYLLVQIF